MLLMSASYHATALHGKLGNRRNAILNMEIQFGEFSVTSLPSSRRDDSA
jgi:hypothetical protein